MGLACAPLRLRAGSSHEVLLVASCAALCVALLLRPALPMRSRCAPPMLTLLQLVQDLIEDADTHCEAPDETELHALHKRALAVMDALADAGGWVGGRAGGRGGARPAAVVAPCMLCGRCYARGGGGARHALVCTTG